MARNEPLWMFLPALVQLVAPGPRRVRTLGPTQEKNGAAAPFSPWCVRRPAAASGHFAHLRLLVVLQPDLVDQIDLGFQEVDVLFRVVQDVLQQIA